MVKNFKNEFYVKKLTYKIYLYKFSTHFTSAKHILRGELNVDSLWMNYSPSAALVDLKKKRKGRLFLIVLVLNFVDFFHNQIKALFAAICHCWRHKIFDHDDYCYPTKTFNTALLYYRKYFLYIHFLLYSWHLFLFFSSPSLFFYFFTFFHNFFLLTLWVGVGGCPTLKWYK